MLTIDAWSDRWDALEHPPDKKRQTLPVHASSWIESEESVLEIRYVQSI